MNEEILRKIAKETINKSIMETLDSALIFKYISELESRLKTASDRIEYYLLDNFEVEKNPDRVRKEFKRLFNILKGDEREK